VTFCTTRFPIPSLSFSLSLSLSLSLPPCFYLSLSYYAALRACSAGNFLSWGETSKWRWRLARKTHRGRERKRGGGGGGGGGKERDFSRIPCFSHEYTSGSSFFFNHAALPTARLLFRGFFAFFFFPFSLSPLPAILII